MCQISANHRKISVNHHGVILVGGMIVGTIFSVGDRFMLSFSNPFSMTEGEFIEFNKLIMEFLEAHNEDS